MASLTTDNNIPDVVRNYLKENVTSKDAILDILCEKLDAIGVECIDDFKDLDEGDIDGLDLKKLHKKKMMKLVAGEINNNNNNQTTTTTTAPASTTAKWDYFISHAQKDGAVFAEGIYSSMKYEQKKTCWLDVKMKERDESAMENGVINSNIFLMIVSKRILPNSFCIKEIEWAVKYKKPIVIVIDVNLKNKIGELLQLCPDHLRNIGSINFIDLNRGDNDYWKLGMKKIVFAKPKVLETMDQKIGSTLKEMEKQYRLPGDKFYESSDYRDALKCYLKWKEELISFYNNTKNESSIELMVCMVKLGETYERSR